MDFFTGHDSYGVEQNNIQATTRFIASIPIEKAASVVSIGERLLLGESLALTEEINITEKGFMHVMERHYPRNGMFLTKSKFSISAREIVEVIKNWLPCRKCCNEAEIM
jgi:hypothetical protein